MTVTLWLVTICIPYLLIVTTIALITILVRFVLVLLEISMAMTKKA